MTEFDKWKERYDKKWCTREQLERLVSLNVLTQEEFDTIVNNKDES